MATRYAICVLPKRVRISRSKTACITRQWTRRASEMVASLKFRRQLEILGNLPKLLITCLLGRMLTILVHFRQRSTTTATHFVQSANKDRSACRTSIRGVEPSFSANSRTIWCTGARSANSAFRIARPTGALPTQSICCRSSAKKAIPLDLLRQLHRRESLHEASRDSLGLAGKSW
jgi:hypothetical protein